MEDGVKVNISDDTQITTLLRISALNNDSIIQQSNGNWVCYGDPTEGAFVVAAEKAGMANKALKEEYKRVSEIPFDSTRKRMTTVHKTPEGKLIKGDYKFTDEFPMADGFEENAEFFTLTYETPLAVSYQTAFARIAPLLWLRAGSMGRRIDKLPSEGWEVADAYGLLVELDRSTDFLKAVRKTKALCIAYIVTDDERRFQALARRLPEGVEAIRLYESYLTNFAFANGDDA